MKRNTYIWVFAMLTVMAFTACIDEKPWERGEGPGVGETAEISFLASTPPATQISTRSQIGSVPENFINDIYVLVFDKSTGDLIKKEKGKNLTVPQGAQNDNKVTFNATLPVGTEYTFMVLANAEDKLSGIETGMSPVKKKSDVLALTVNNTERWNYTSPVIPMWAEKDLNLTASSTPTFGLVRMLARINVEVDLREINGVSPDNFILTSIRYFNYNTAGALVPLRGNFDFVSNTALLPTLPSSPGTQTGTALLYDYDDIDSGISCKEKIYVFEAAHNNRTYNEPSGNDEWINNPCLVIGGIYTTPDGTSLNETFYRVDFIQKEGGSPGNRDIWLSVLRNHSYNITIVEVNGSGFDDPDVALRSAPINMEANILVWDEREMGEIVFDGVFFLSVSRDKLSVISSEVNEEKEENLLYVKTDYTFYNDPTHSDSGWKVDKYVDKYTGDEVSWLKLNPDQAPPDPDNPVKTYFTFEENDWGEPRTAIVWIAAGRLRYPVEVTQNLGWIEIVDPDNGAPIDELRFVVPASGSLAEVKKFQVNWIPSGDPITIGQTTKSDWYPFDPIYLTPSPAPSWTITHGAGTEEYTVTAPPISQDVIRKDPLYERESIYSFTIGTGSNAETVSILLHQVCYNIAVDTDSYHLDGKTYSLSVRSNAEWKIADIEEWLYNKDPSSGSNPTPVLLDPKSSDSLKEGTTGGPNLTGTPLSFTVVDKSNDPHKGKYGTVYVTFESTDGKFDPVRVPIYFRAPKMTLLGLSRVEDVRGYTTTAPSIYHSNALYDVLNNRENFGPNGVVKVDELNLVSERANDFSLDPIAGKDNVQWRRGYLQDWLNEYNPDVIIMVYSTRLKAAEANLIMEYLENGGVMLCYMGGNEYSESDSRQAAEVFFGQSLTGFVSPGVAKTQLLGDQARVFVTEDIDHPILNGPFGDMRNHNWGTVQEFFCVHESIISDDYDILCKTNSQLPPINAAFNPLQGYAHMLKHKRLNLYWIGNNKNTGTYYHNQMDNFPYYDANYVVNGKPLLRPGFGAGIGTFYPKYDVYNSIIFANAIAWAISVTNHRPPTGGYTGYSGSDYW